MRSATSHRKRFSVDECYQLLRDCTQEIRTTGNTAVDLSSYTSFGLVALSELATYGAALSQYVLKKQGQSAPVRMVPPSSPDACQFLARIGFFRLCSGAQLYSGLDQFLAQDRELPRTARSYVPFRRIANRSKPGESKELAEHRFESECRDTINALHDSFERVLTDTLSCGTQETHGFWRSNIELLQNIYRHSGASGWVAIQTYDKETEVCYSDTGVGLMATLSDQAADIQRATGLEWGPEAAATGAFELGISSSGGESRGAGLHLVRSFAQQSGGSVVCRSDSLRTTFGAGTETSWAPSLPGVLILLRLPWGVS